MESLVCVKVNFDFADACTYFEQAQVAVLVHLIPYVSSKYLYEVTSKLPDFIQVNNLTNQPAELHQRKPFMCWINKKHTTPMLSSLHWLLVQFMIDFKMPLLLFIALHMPLNTLLTS